MKAATRLLLLLALTGCWDLPSGDKTSVYFWSDLFLDKYEHELVVGELEAGPEPLAEPRVVLLITGVTIRERWFDPIVARLERDGFIPVVWEPPALLSGSLFEASELLAEVVEQVLADSGQKRIDILAECTGGVIARYYLQSLGGDARISRLVTFVSPQNGIAKAPLAAGIAGWPARRDLSPGSEFLQAVHSKPLPSNVPVTSIYTCTDEYIQPYETSIIEGATNIGLCDGFVGHFQTFYDPAIYLVMHEALTAPLPGDPEVWHAIPALPDAEPEAPPESPESDDSVEPAPTSPLQPPPTERLTSGDAAPAASEGAAAVAPPPQVVYVGCTSSGGAPASPWWFAAALLGVAGIRRMGSGGLTRRRAATEHAAR